MTNENNYQNKQREGHSSSDGRPDDYRDLRFPSWNRHTQDSHNYVRGDDEDASEYFGRLHTRYELLANMEATRKHLTFYTHTNPFGCPWCELFVVAGLAIRGGSELAGVYEELLGEFESWKEEGINQQSPPMTTRTEHQNNRSETGAVLYEKVVLKKEEKLSPGDDGPEEFDESGGSSVVGVEEPKD